MVIMQIAMVFFTSLCVIPYYDKNLIGVASVFT